MTAHHISPDGFWRWDGAQWVPVQAAVQAPAQPQRHGPGGWNTGGVIGGVVSAAVLAPVIFPNTSIGEGAGLGAWL